MKIKLEEFEVDTMNPFKNDTLNRKENAEILTQFVSSIDEPYVIAINSEWGTGKTTFLKMWQRHLELQKFNVIYFNAWENDFNVDPLIPLINEIENCISSFDKSEKMQTAIDKMKLFAFSLIKRAIPQTIKLSTAGLVDAPKIIEDSIASVSEELAKEKFEDYEKTKRSFLNFKETVQNLAETIGCKNPIVFIIDELDRCRPNYAIELIEKVKHLFCTRNIVFVLGIDKKQLGNAATVLYGNIDTNGYLDRLIDIDYFLPEPNIKTFVEHTLNQHNWTIFFEGRKEYRDFQSDKHIVIEVFSALFIKFQLSLRQIHQTLSQFIIVLRLTKENQYLFPSIISFLLVLRKTQNELYKKILSANYKVEDLMSSLDLASLDLDSYRRELIIYEITTHLELHLTTKKINYNPVEKYTLLLSENAENNQLTKKFQTILNHLEKMQSRGFTGGVSVSLEKIQLLKPFEHT